ncbi:serine hydrolase domain-containing protein [Actinokineospora sp. 24-640]
MRLVIVGAVVGLGLAGCGVKADEPAPLGVVERLAQVGDALHRQGMRGVVKVRKDGEVLFSRAYGTADAAAGTPNEPGTRFMIGSITKQVTAVGVLVLDERGLLDVQDPVCEHLASCPATWSGITIHHLLTHTAGLERDYTGYTPEEERRFTASPPTHAELVPLIQRPPLTGPPGGGFSYSNLGYVLLGAVIERVSGTGYATFIEENVLAPLGMASTDMVPKGAVGYASGDTPAEIPPLLPYADGGLVSTAADLGRWSDFLITATPAVLTPDALTLMRQPHVELDASQSYGYGVQVRGNTFGHSGHTPGFRSELHINPEHGLSVVALSNQEGYDPAKTVAQIAELAATAK